MAAKHISRIMLVVGIFLLFSVSYSADTGKSDGKAARIGMELQPRGKGLVLKLTRPAEVAVYLKGKKVHGCKRGLECKIPYKVATMADELTFVCTDGGYTEKKTHSLKRFAHLFVTPEKKPPSMKTSEPKALASKNAKEPKTMSSSNMSKDRVAASQVSERPGSPTAPNRAAGKRIDLTPENRVIGGPFASTESLTEPANADKIPRQASKQMAQVPRRKREAVGVERGTTEEGIIIERPIGGTRVHAGNGVTIRWEYVESVFEEYRGGVMSVDLYVRSVADPTSILWFYTAGSDREVTWHIPSETPPGTYTINARFDSGSGLYSGSTHIEVLASSDVVLLWPPEINPGETILYVGYRYPITWNAYGEADGRRYNIELMDGGRSFNVIASSVNPPSRRLDWVVGGDCSRSSTVPRGDNFRVRLSTADAPFFETLSAPLTIRLPTIAVDVRPRAGDRWRIGSSQLIAWNTDHVPEGSRVTLRLLKGGRDYLLIEENQPNTGSFAWEEAGVEKYTGPITSGSISRRQASPGNDYSIQVEMESCPLVYGISPVFELYE
jgi:hypothetical protein